MIEGRVIYSRAEWVRMLTMTRYYLLVTVLETAVWVVITLITALIKSLIKYKLPRDGRSPLTGWKTGLNDNARLDGKSIINTPVMAWINRGRERNRHVNLEPRLRPG